MIEEIRRRRSIRQYLPKPVPEESIESMLRAAMQAPTARNHQPWEFVVVTRRDILGRVPDYHARSSMVPGAGAAILVCGDLRLQEEPGYLAQDCAAAVQNMLLQAVTEGLGAVWLGVYPNPDRIAGMRELFRLPDSILPVAMVSVGFPAEEKDFEDRFTPDKVHRDTW